MTLEELHILMQAETRQAIEDNIERKHTDVALDKSLCASRLVAQQVKYLQRAKQKLPTFYGARCIIPPLAFEQSSSEIAAEHKLLDGDSVLELTCGLGVDALALSRRFRRVVTLEIDEVLAETVRENFRRLGVKNVEVLTTSAEEYLSGCSEQFDWIYVDPDRRSEDGRKCVVLEDCSPNIIELMGDMRRVSRRLAVKCSPLFDVDEAFRIFPMSRVESVSLGDECKEVVIYNDGGDCEMVGATALGKSSVWVERSSINDYESSREVDLESYRYLVIPDVSLQKSRVVRRVLSQICSIWSENGFGFMSEREYESYDSELYASRIFGIDYIADYNPKKIRKILSERGIKSAEIFKRESPYSNSQIAKQLNIKEGGACKIAVTKLENRTIIAILSR